MFGLDDLERATAVVGAVMPPTPQYAWPLLQRRLQRRSRNQAREPHSHRRLQGARRGHARQSRPDTTHAAAARRGRRSFLEEALRLLPLYRGRPRGLRQGRRLRDPPKRHPRSRALQALWSGPDHACAPGVRRANACGFASRTFSKTSRPAAASRLARSVKHPGRVQARLKGTRDQLLPLLLAPHRCALSPLRRSHEHPGALGRQKFRFHCGVAGAVPAGSRRVAAGV
jgi:hypothetical protein